MEENQNPQASAPQNEGNDAPQQRRRPRIGEQRFRDAGNYENSPRPSFMRGENVREGYGYSRNNNGW